MPGPHKGLIEGEMDKSIEIQGYCDTRFQAVKERFARNFELGLEVGASFAAMIDGEYV